MNKTTYLITTNEIGKYVKHKYLLYNASLDDLQKIMDKLGHYENLQLSWTAEYNFESLIITNDYKYLNVTDFIKKVKHELDFDKNVNDSEEMVKLKTLLIQNKIPFVTHDNDYIICKFSVNEKFWFEFDILFKDNQFTVTIFNDCEFQIIANTYTVQKPSENDLKLGYIYDRYKFVKAPSTVNVNELEESIYAKENSFEYGRLTPQTI